jgi:hypothetical protein
MIETYLVPEKTVLNAKGESQPIDISAAQSRVFLLTLNIAEIVEQESLDISIFGSADGATWEPKPLAVFPQRFYRGETPILLDISEQPAVKFVRAHWDVNRWGRGPEEPMFEISLGLREVPRDVLAEVRKEAAGRK